MKLIKLKIPIPFKGLNKNRRSMVGLNNLVDLILTCITHPNAINKVFLVSDNNDLSTAHLIRLLGKTIGYSPRMFCFNKALSFVAKILGSSNKYDRLAGSLRVNIGRNLQKFRLVSSF